MVLLLVAGVPADGSREGPDGLRPTGQAPARVEMTTRDGATAGCGADPRHRAAPRWCARHGADADLTVGGRRSRERPSWSATIGGDHRRAHRANARNVGCSVALIAGAPWSPMV